MTGLIAAIFWLGLLGGVAVVIYRIVVLPRRLRGVGRSIETISDTLKHRQADKAAGKPVEPINILGLVGVACAVVGIIVARTTNGLLGLGIMIIGMGMLLIGFNKLKVKRHVTGQGSYPGQQSGPRVDGRGGDGSSDPGPVSTPSSSDFAEIPASRAQPEASVNTPPHDIPLLADTRQIDLNSPPGDTKLSVGGTAKIVSTDNRFAGRVGQVVALDGPNVDIKFRGTVGSLSFRSKDVIAISEPTEDMPRAAIVTNGRIAPGAMAKVLSGNPRYVGQVGRVVSVARGTITLKMNGTFRAFDFKISDVAAL